jgi:hypothetical protein
MLAGFVHATPPPEFEPADVDEVDEEELDKVDTVNDPSLARMLLGFIHGDADKSDDAAPPPFGPKLDPENENTLCSPGL